MCEKNELGCTVQRSFFYGRDRYYYDIRLLFQGSNWYRVCTEDDCANYGIWINPVRHQVLTWSEGDQMLITAPTKTSWLAQLEHTRAFHQTFVIEWDGEEPQEVTLNSRRLHQGLNKSDSPSQEYRNAIHLATA